VPTASTIKLLVYVEAFHQIQDLKKSLSDEITLQKEDQVPGSGVLQYLRTPHQLTLEDALSLMMIESDNTATNLVIDQLGLTNKKQARRNAGSQEHLPLQEGLSESGRADAAGPEEIRTGKDNRGGDAADHAVDR
jgi:beta-lactamase class A